ncbi:MAG TPA: hypothetical protein ENK18_25000 [Deltaproteobacteria bacterium]|nr:hypothetical protein [Deltaproteobacteria bacterium]
MLQLLLLSWPLGMGCRAIEDAKLAGRPLSDVDIVAVFPPDGSAHLWGDVPVQVILGAAGVDKPVEIEVSRGGSDPVTTGCVLDHHGVVMACDPILGIEPGEDVSFEVRVGDTVHQVDASGQIPAPGLGWSLLDGVNATALGKGDAAVGLLEDAIRQGGAFATLSDPVDASGLRTFTFAPSGLDPYGAIGIAPWGFTFVLDVTVEDGRLAGQADSAWLAGAFGPHEIQLLLLDVELQGRLQGEELSELVLVAAVPALALVELSDALGSLGLEVLEVVALDLDLDGDGHPDAAQLRLEGSPAPAALAAWSLPSP